MISNFRKYLIHTLMLFVCIKAFSSEFNYLSIAENNIKTTHGIALNLGKIKDWSHYGPFNYNATFHEHPFNISMAFYHNEKSLVAIHAEKLSDNSNYLDYSYLEQTEIAGKTFFFSEKCVHLNDKQIKEAKDLSIFKEYGFSFSPTIILKQFFITSLDKNSEVVITLAEKAENCSVGKIDKQFEQKVLATIRFEE